MAVPANGGWDPNFKPAGAPQEYPQGQPLPGWGPGQGGPNQGGGSAAPNLGGFGLQGPQPIQRWGNNGAIVGSQPGYQNIIQGMGAPAWGGSPGGANVASNMYQKQAQDYAHHSIGNQLSDPLRQNSMDDAKSQQAAIDMQMNAANGGAPSAAAIGQAQGIDASLAGSVHGANAGLNAAGGAQGATQQGAYGRANEIGQAQAGVMGGQSALSGSNLQGMGTDIGRTLANQGWRQKGILGSQELGNQALVDQLHADQARFGSSYAGSRGFMSAQDIGNQQYGANLGAAGLGMGAGALGYLGSNKNPANQDEA